MSVRPAGSNELRTRTELKNMNSFNHIGRGIEAEVARQVEVWSPAASVEQDTYDFDVSSGTLTPAARRRRRTTTATSLSPTSSPSNRLRSLSSAYAGSCPSCPRRGSRRIAERLDHERALVLVTGGLDPLWEATVAAGADVVAAANVVANQLVGAGVDPAAANATELAKLVEARDRIPRKAFDEAISHVGDPGFDAEPYVAREAVSDAASLEPVVDAILAANPGQVEAYRGGKQGLLGFFVGQVMKETQGSADARVVSELVRAKLEA